MIGAFVQPHVLQRSHGLGFIRHAVKVLREHHIFQRSQVGNEVKLLKDKSDFL
jgi:hypothetical protein